MKSIEELALKVAKEMWNRNGVYSGHPLSEMQDFAARFLATYTEQQEPVATVKNGKVHRHNGWPAYGTKLYAAPVVPAGWIRAVDEAMVSSHLGVADATDTYEEARKKLNALICWNNDVATDPAVNGGMVLVSREPTEAMIRASWDCAGVTSPADGQRKYIAIAWQAMLSAAGEKS